MLSLRVAQFQEEIYRRTGPIIFKLARVQSENAEVFAIFATPFADSGRATQSSLKQPNWPQF